MLPNYELLDVLLVEWVCCLGGQGATCRVSSLLPCHAYSTDQLCRWKLDLSSSSYKASHGSRSHVALTQLGWALQVMYPASPFPLKLYLCLSCPCTDCFVYLGSCILKLSKPLKAGGWFLLLRIDGQINNQRHVKGPSPKPVKAVTISNVCKFNIFLAFFFYRWLCEY